MERSVTGVSWSRVREVSFQIPAKAGTTIRALAGFGSGVMWGFQNGLRSRTTYVRWVGRGRLGGLGNADRQTGVSVVLQSICAGAVWGAIEITWSFQMV